MILNLQIDGAAAGSIPPGEYDTKFISASERRPDGTFSVDVEFIQCVDCPYDGFVQLAIADRHACDPCVYGTKMKLNIR